LYATDPSTSVILAAYAFDDDPVNLWQPHLEGMPHDLAAAFDNPEVEIWAWNCSFERNITKWVLDIDLPIRRFKDTMVQARYLALPGSLDECGKTLKLPSNLLKMDEGTKLKNMFCLPAKKGGEETLFGLSKTVFRDAESDPKEWEKFCQYNKQDVVSERAIGEKLKDFPVLNQEWDLFYIDQEINDRGVYVDSRLVEGGSYIAEVIKKEYSIQLDEITGLENPNSTDQLLEWLSGEGYSFHSLGKPFVMRALAGECKLTPKGERVLKIRQQSSKTSASKLIGIKNQLSSDGRLRHQYSFYGASRTGRWSSGSGE
jgi:DNA polymerase